MSVNVTNNKVLIRAFAEDSEALLGKTIELFAGKAIYQGGETDSVLVNAFATGCDKEAALRRGREAG